jgi:hypothetical protein
MGHAEMGLAVVGQKDEEILERAKKLSNGEWSSLFAPAERLALNFAVKLSRKPWAVTEKDIEELTAALGRHRALDVIWRASWANYMTRVADSFQFPLEKENVFMPPERLKRGR